MKLFTCLFCVFILSTMYSQREYKFDYEVQYQFKSKLRNLNYTRTYFINSSDNSYYAVKIPIEKSKFKLQIIDYNGLIAIQNFDANELNKSIVVLKSINANHYSNPYKFQINNYDFEKHNDTMVDGKRFINVDLASTNLKIKQKKYIGSYKYLVDPSFEFLPMLEFSTAYEIWKSRNNFPKGMLTQHYLYNAKKEIESSLLFKELTYRDFKISFSN